MHHDVIAIALLVWSMLGLRMEAAPELVPRAWVIVRRDVRAYIDAVLIRIGEMPTLGPGHLVLDGSLMLARRRLDPVGGISGQAGARSRRSE
jgi:hypothetical protein